MAQELMLVPKVKYEHLLKQIEEMKGFHVGGNISESKLEADPVNPSQILPDEQQIEKTEPDVKPTIYVEKPLSEMEFNRRKVVKRKSIKKESPHRRKMSKKKQWINFSL